MLEIISNITKNVLMSIYKITGASVLTAFLFMYMYPILKRKGFKGTINIWIRRFKRSKDFSLVFFTAVFISMMLFKTLLCRDVWIGTFSNVIGTWMIHTEDNNLNTEGLENILLFIPMTLLLLSVFRSRLFAKRRWCFKSVLFYSFVISFLFSLGIECTQMFMRLGFVQLSDIVFNTVGGVIGGLLFYIFIKLKKKRRSE